MPTATEATATATATGSGAIAQQINSTQAALETIRQQRAELMNDERRAEAELHAQQQQLTTAREAEAAAAAEAELSENLKTLKAQAAKLNKASAALAELWAEWKPAYKSYIDSLPAEQQGAYYGMGARSFSPEALPFVAMEEGSAKIRVTSLGQQPKQ